MTQPDACHDPTNGGKPRCVRDDDFDELRQEQSGFHTSLQRFQERVTNEFLGVFGTMSRIETKVDRLLEGYEIGNVRPAMASLDYGEGEDTAVQDRPIVVARMKSAERAAVSLEEENAALRATLEERTRQSERARAVAQEANDNALKSNELAVSKWKVTAGLIVGALMAIAAIGQALASAFGG